MSRFGLSPRFLSATLFIAAGLQAQDMTPPAKAAATPAAKSAARAQDLLKRFDKNGDGRIDDDERADAQETMLKERMDRQAKAAPGAAEAEQFRARMLELFDKNRDGRLDDEERAGAQKYAEDHGLGPTGAVRDDLIQRFDRNGNGKIDDAERPAMETFLAQRRLPDTERIALIRQELLARFDFNSDAKIDEQEMKTAETLLRPEIETNASRRERYDLNADGKLDDAEWTAARRHILVWLNEGGLPFASAASPAEEKARLDKVAEEVRKRRELREKMGK